MLKTIKTKKQMRLDELIKYVWDNKSLIKGKIHTDFKSEEGRTVYFEETGVFSTSYGIEADETFTIYVEEPITEDTVFKCLLEIIDGELVYIRNKKTIKESVKDDTDRFYALINGRLELVWKRDEDE